MMPKSDTISAITRLNSTASPEFLAEFSNHELTDYLRRLADLRNPRPAADRAHPDEEPLVAATLMFCDS